MAEDSGGKLLFNAGPGLTAFSINATGLAASTLGLTSGTSSADNFDLVIATRGGAVDSVFLDGAASVGAVIEKIINQTGGSGSIDLSDPTVVAGLTFGHVQVGFNDDRAGLKFTDLTAGSSTFGIVPVNSSKAAFDLRIVGTEGTEDTNGDSVVDSFDGYGIIEGGQIAGVTLLDRFFVENAVFDADLAFSTPTGVHAEANFANFVSILLDGNGSIDAGLELGLKNPNTDIIGDRVTLTQLIQGISDPSTVIATPAFSGGGALTFWSDFDHFAGRYFQPDPARRRPADTAPDHRGLRQSFRGLGERCLRSAVSTSATSALTCASTCPAWRNTMSR